ncbi:hypothetical protein [Methylomonas sp. 11b]|uniref:hypothetical protein n=1 Tax=Methylomonas sp. 11b TaxID=1168169 RepID=UPI0012DEE2FE|nr:hypothetical protein [Methylomonas sp. 11b]
MFSLRTLTWFCLLVSGYASLWLFVIGPGPLITSFLFYTMGLFFIPAFLLQIFGAPMFIDDGIFPTPTTVGWVITSIFATIVFWIIAWGFARLTQRLTGTRASRRLRDKAGPAG